MKDKGVVYQGAVRSIMDGERPELEELFTELLKANHSIGAIQPSHVSLKASPQDDYEEPVDTPPEEADYTVFAGIHSRPKIPSHIFRTYDIRGIVGRDISPPVIRAIGAAIGRESRDRGQQNIVVAQDGRLSSPQLGEALIAGLRAAECNVIDIGITPTPLLYFATHQLEISSGVMLTGSHNSPEYNGLKIVLDGKTLAGDDIIAIRDRVTDNDDVAKGRGGLSTANIDGDYLKKVLKSVPVGSGKTFKIVVDCGNGVAGKIAPQLYRALGHEVVELFCDVDGNFPNHHPDPSQPENLQALIDMVKREKADIGFAFDGDGDRLGIVDSEGNIIWPDRQMMLFAQDILTRNQGATIVFDVKCSRYLKTIIENHNGVPLMWKTGHSLIKSKMREVNAPLAGEMSGHIFFKERWYGFDDALYAGARMLEILSQSKHRITDTFAELPESIATPELRIPLAEQYHAEVMQEVKEKMAFKDAEITTIDGLRVDFKDGWGLIRPSNTTPLLVARFEAENKEALNRIQTKFRQLLNAVQADLDLPF